MVNFTDSFYEGNLLDLPEEQKVLLYVLYFIDKGIDEKIIKGEKILTDSGKSQAKRLIDSGYKPNALKSNLMYKFLLKNYKLEEI